MECQILGVNFLQIDQLIDHRKEITCIAIDHFQVFFPIGIARFFDQLPRGAEDECQWCFELMGNIGEIGDLISVQLFHLLGHFKDGIFLLVDLYILQL